MDLGEHVAHQHKMEFDYKKRNSCCNSLDIVVHIVIQHMEPQGIIRYFQLSSLLMNLEKGSQGLVVSRHMKTS